MFLNMESYRNVYVGRRNRSLSEGFEGEEQAAG